MIRNIINRFNNHSFLSQPLKVVQSLAWVALAILALPTVVGSYLAWKKAVAIWSKNERSETKTVNDLAEKVLIKKTTEDLLNEWERKASKGENRVIAKQRILGFLANQSDYLDLSELGLHSLPNCFNDERFLKLRRVNLSNNHSLINLPPTAQGLDMHTIFRSLDWRAEKLSHPCVEEDVDLDADDFAVFAPTQETTVQSIEVERKRALYEAAISQFRSSKCLGSRSAEAYFDYLKSTGQGFHFNMDLLHSQAPAFDVFVAKIKEEIQRAEQENASLVFVPFLLAGNALREQHIVVAVVNTAKQQIEYFDSKGNRFYSIFGRLVDRKLPQWEMLSQDFLRNLGTALFPDKKDLLVIRNMSGPQSLMNRVDCGAHALDFIQTRLDTDIIQSENPHYFEIPLSSDARQLRKEMASILQGRLVTIE